MPTPKTSPANTSEGKCAPRNTRSSPTVIATRTAAATDSRRHVWDSSGQSRKTSTETTTAMFVACPEGKE